MTARRDFLKQMSALGLLSAVPDQLFAQAAPAKEKIWACLLHLSFNMWEEYIHPKIPDRGFRPELRLSEPLWQDSLKQMVASGMNMVMIDLGDAVKYDSHPEIAVKNAWTPQRLHDELGKMRKMGLEPIPKLNFSTGHDTWMGPYSRMVSTDKYYTVCSDLIAEVSRIFNKPRFFHLGMDEETAQHQVTYEYVVIRQKELWWHDLFFLAEQVEKAGPRPWIWSDFMWHHPEEFFKKMPKSIVQSNWYYKTVFDEKNPHVKAYLDLEAHGYDQVPCGSNFNEPLSISATVEYCNKHVADERLMGFLQTVWKSSTETNREAILAGIELTGKAKQWFKANHR